MSLDFIAILYILFACTSFTSPETILAFLKFITGNRLDLTHGVMPVILGAIRGFLTGMAFVYLVNTHLVHRWRDF